MIRLQTEARQAELDLGRGVTVRVRPFTRALSAAAMAEPEVEAIDPAQHPQAYGVAYAAALARHAIVDWDGIGDADGAAVPAEARWIDALMADDGFFAAWCEAYVTPADEADSEKNGSAPSPNGISAGAGTTAPAAPGRARPAPTGSTGH